MASIRQEKINRLLLRELGIYFQQASKNRYAGAMITPTIVRVSPDLGLAKVYLSLWGVADNEALLEKIKENGWEVRKEVGNKIRHQLRVVPEFHFYIDDSLDYAENIDKLLKD